MYFLIHFRYNFQGHSDTKETVLVRADNFLLATKAISKQYKNAHDFINMTIMA